MWCHKPYTKGQIPSLSGEGQLSFRNQMKLDANTFGQRTVKACGNHQSTGSFPSLQNRGEGPEQQFPRPRRKLHPHFWMQLCKILVEIEECGITMFPITSILLGPVPAKQGRGQCWARRAQGLILKPVPDQTERSGTLEKKQFASSWQSLSNQNGVLPRLGHLSSQNQRFSGYRTHPISPKMWTLKNSLLQEQVAPLATGQCEVLIAD